MAAATTSLWNLTVGAGVLALILGTTTSVWGYRDQTVTRYTNERTCWWNEICKEEFQSEFRCRCPRWSFCRSPGKYYNAFCSVMASGYIWTQPRFPPAGGGRLRHGRK